jgi:hypothetical protein
MSKQSSAAEGQTALLAKQPKPQKTTTGRRLMQIGCLPFILILVGCLLLFVNQVVVSQAPTGVSDPEEYVLGQRITGSLGTLIGLQVIGMWLLGLVAAATAAPAAAGQGEMLQQRLTILRRRVAIIAWGVFLLRVMLLIALVVSAALAYTYIADVRSSFRIARSPHPIEIVALASIVGTVLAHWLSGPFLRLRYSTALGVWGASWTYRRDQRVWMALTARMGVGMWGSLALLWGSVLGVLIIATIHQPFSRSATIDFQRVFFPFLPRDSWVEIVLLLGLSALIILYMIGQLALPPFYLWLARRRLAGRSAADPHERFAKRFFEPLEKPPAAPG